MNTEKNVDFAPLILVASFILTLLITDSFLIALLISIPIFYVFKLISSYISPLKTGTQTSSAPVATPPHIKADQKSVWTPEKLNFISSEMTVVFYKNCLVAGVSYKNSDLSCRQMIIQSRCHEGETLNLMRETSNKFSPAAIAVYIEDQQLGYIPHDLAIKLITYLDDPAYSGVAFIDQIYNSKKHKNHGLSIDILVYKTSKNSNKANINGTSVKTILEHNKNNLEIMMNCCKAEITAFNTRPKGCAPAPNHSPFTRASIIASKNKNYALVASICNEWINLVERYESQPLVIDGDWKSIQDTLYHKRLIQRRVDALQKNESKS